MTSSLTITESTSFTVTHARHLASKIATDLHRMQRFYGSPADARIEAFEAEAIALMRAGYLKSVSYGFWRNDKWIAPSLHYNASDAFVFATGDDDPGGVQPGADITGASFYSYLTYSSAWFALSETQKTSFEGGLPLQRGSAAPPGIDGYLTQDRTYMAGNKSLVRSTIRSL